ncbi:uncharacterized protein O3C94_018724 [Discoglossus pictus]
MDPMGVEQMRQSILNFSLEDCALGSQGYTRVLLQLFGFTGHGKSSFINSCKYVVDGGDYVSHARVAEKTNKPETMIRNAYELTPNITLVDNRGCVKMNKEETGEIYAQLGNFLPLNRKVNWEKDFYGILENVLESERDQRLTDFIAPIFVYSVETGIAGEAFDELRQLLEDAKQITEIVPTVVLTHETNRNLADVKEKFRQMGVKIMCPLENYTEKDHIKLRGKHEVILKCLCEVLQDVKFRMEQERNLMDENIRRKRILLRFAYERGLEKQKEQLSKEFMQGGKNKNSGCRNQ